MRYTAFTPETEISGQALLMDLQNLRRTLIMPVLSKHDLSDISPNQWYPQQKWLDILRDLASNPRSVYDYAAIGIQIAERLPFPEDTDSVPAAFTALSHMYYRDYRNGDAGDITCHQEGERQVYIYARTPYPPDFIYGIIYGVAWRFVPRDSTLNVLQDNIQGTLYHDVSW